MKSKERLVLYCVVGALLVTLAIVATVTWRGAQEGRAAEEKADRLIAALEELGARVPSREQIVRVLGDDGGPVCADPAGVLSHAFDLTQMSNGAGGPGARPIIANSNLAKGELVVISIYCPDKLSDFKSYIDDLRTADVNDE